MTKPTWQSKHFNKMITPTPIPDCGYKEVPATCCMRGNGCHHTPPKGNPDNYATSNRYPGIH